MKIRKHANGNFYAWFVTTHGRRSISLRTRSFEEAKRNATESRIAEMEKAAEVHALTAETFSRILAGRKTIGQQAFDEWIRWASTSNLSSNSISTYRRYIAIFLRDFEFIQRSLNNVSLHDLDAFVNGASDLSANTRRNRLHSLRSFFKIACARGYSATDPTLAIDVKLSGLSFDQKEPAVREPFTESDLEKMRTITDPFWRTFVLLGENFGLRLSDVAQLERACIEKPGVIVIWTDKRDRRLELPLPGMVLNHLQSLPRTDPEFFFPKERATSLDTTRRSNLSVYFVRLIRRLGIARGSAHCLRHAYATRRLHLGATVDEIRLALGHTSIETTKIYLHPKRAG